MPPVREAADEVIAVLCSDLHLSHKPPLARSVEEDWYGAMNRHLRQLKALATPKLLEPQLPVIVAGDVFDKWNPPPELINFAIRYMPKVYAVPGQHDLPYHSYDDLQKTGYCTLIEAGVVFDVPPGIPVDLPGRTPMTLHGFPWGYPVTPLEDPCAVAVEIAVVHDYLWVKGAGYDGAPDDKRVKNRKGQFQGYDVAVVGDNHTPFDVAASGCQVFNCGGFMRRKADERSHRPRVGLLRADGSVTSHYLDVSSDKFLEGDDAAQVMNGIGCESLIEELTTLGVGALDFADAVRRLLDRDKVAPGVKKLILRAMEK